MRLKELQIEEGLVDLDGNPVKSITTKTKPKKERLSVLDKADKAPRTKLEPRVPRMAGTLPRYYGEAATAGATASGNIAAVVNPHVANPSRKSVAYTGKPGGPSGEGPVAQYVAKKQKPTDNALDGDKLLMSSKTPQMIRRQIEEGSAYILNEKQLSELWPALAGAALAGYGIYKGGQALGNWMGKEKGKTQAAHDKRMQNAGLATPTPKKKKKTDEDGKWGTPKTKVPKWGTPKPGGKWGTPKPSGKWGVPKPGASNKTNEDYHSPAGEIAQDHADDFDTLMKQRSKAAHDAKSSKRIAKTEKSKRKTAKAAGFHAMMSRRPLSGIAKDSAQKGHQPAWSGLGEG